MSDKGVATSREASATTALVLAARLATQSIEAVLSSDELNMDHFLVLEALAVRPGLTMAELRDRTHTPAPTLTRVVDRLVSVAAVYREADAHDRRKTRVYLSVRGRKLFDRLSASVRDVEQAWPGPLPGGLPSDVHPILATLEEATTREPRGRMSHGFDRIDPM
ncbi:MarR family winged helix-turn-helix transcriptional regulator [Rhodococcus rhodochrous]|uniref:MarR family transcriptional regulator n=1 Tax=Rhodococcus rhodochrous KG-21 TaxID=1441923 RepID=A0A0M8PNZ8_RHORH|nr:MarR family transcriptional regulator [Rhodococcus rhodochrous]KOS55618.1 MarR family transcriptional regulator [Rhodococcus rhodochrous KG-21]